jgi:hypothetical protein
LWSEENSSAILFGGAGFTGCGKSGLFCHSERSEESLFDLTGEREIPLRAARLGMTKISVFPHAVQPPDFPPAKPRLTIRSQHQKVR